MLVLFQTLFIFFAIFAIGSVVKKKKEGLLGLRGMLFWVLFWLAACGFILWPNSTAVLAGYLGIGRGADLVFYVALVVIFYVLFRLHIKIETMSRDITKVVRKEALDK